MKTKKYWLRGVVAGIFVYVVFFVISLILIFSGTMTCNILVTTGPGVQESMWCGPVLTLAGLPLMLFGELVEDISSGTITHFWLYLGCISAIVVYLGIFAIAGHLYGKRRDKARVI